MHCLADDEYRYETYERSLAPALQPWLGACAQVYDDPVIVQIVEQVGYGYINTFHFPAARFDLTTIVRLELGVEIHGMRDGLDRFDIRLHYRDELEPTAHVAVQVVVQPELTPEMVRVQTKVTATVMLPGGWTDRSFVERQVLAAKAVAKRAFFDLVTDETRQMMGAQYENPA